MSHRFVLPAAVAILSAGSLQAADQKSEMVVVGCLQRGVPNAYVVKDHRSGASFEARGDNTSPERTLRWQVGHLLEIHGTLESQSAGQKRRLRVTTVIEISATCPKE